MLSAMPWTSASMSSGSGVSVRRPSRDSRRIALISRSIFWVEVRMKPIASGRSSRTARSASSADQPGAPRVYLVEHGDQRLRAASSSAVKPMTLTSGERRSWRDDIGEALDLVVGAVEIGGALLHHLLQISHSGASAAPRRGEVAGIAQQNDQCRRADQHDQHTGQGQQGVEKLQAALQPRVALHQQPRFLGAHRSRNLTDLAGKLDAGIGIEGGEGLLDVAGADQIHAVALVRLLLAKQAAEGIDAHLLPRIVASGEADLIDQLGGIARELLIDLAKAVVTVQQIAAPRGFHALEAGGEIADQTLDLPRMLTQPL